MDDNQRQTALYSLIERMNRHGWTGKTAVQKLVFFVQEAAGIDFGFRYVIHHYGPYSFDLNTFMQSLDARGVLTIVRESDGYGFNVKVGDLTPGGKVEESVDRKLGAVDKCLGGASTDDLELWSTCLYIVRRFPNITSEEQTELVRGLKPRFPEEQVEKGISKALQVASALQAA